MYTVSIKLTYLESQGGLFSKEHLENHTVTLTIGYAHLTIINTNRIHNE